MSFKEEKNKLFQRENLHLIIKNQYKIIVNIFSEYFSHPFPFNYHIFHLLKYINI